MTRAVPAPIFDSGPSVGFGARAAPIALIGEPGELRDRYLEAMNAPGGRVLPAAALEGKYEVSRPRSLDSGFTADPRTAEVAEGVRLLDAG